jgi:hypothetical protein
MADSLSFAEFEGQQAELLPARTVLSMFSMHNDCSGGDGTGGIGINLLNIAAGVLGDANQTNNAAIGTGGPGGKC